jgi:hypothetical protein
MRAAAAVAMTVCISGCAAVGDITGAVAGLASGAATGNPAVGISVGIAVRAGASNLVDRVVRRRKENEQDAIAAVAAGMNVGEVRAWAVDQKLRGDTYGEVQVLRTIPSSLTLCKELLFWVAEEGDDTKRGWFTTVACEHDGGWKWAAAEPAVERWVNLQ